MRIRLWPAAIFALSTVVLACGSFQTSSSGEPAASDGGTGEGGASTTDAAQNGGDAGGLPGPDGSVPESGAAYPPGGSFEGAVNASCGARSITPSGFLVASGHEGTACRVCSTTGGGNPVELWVEPLAGFNPVANTSYKASIWARLSEGTGTATGYLYFKDSSFAGGPPTDRDPAQNPVGDAWAVVPAYSHRAKAGETGLLPGANFEVTAGVCVDIDDFMLTVGP